MVKIPSIIRVPPIARTPPIRSMKSSLKRSLTMTRYGRKWNTTKHRGFWQKLGLG